MNVKHILSYGGGVDSTALFLLLKYIEKVSDKCGQHDSMIIEFRR